MSAPVVACGIDQHGELFCATRESGDIPAVAVPLALFADPALSEAIVARIDAVLAQAIEYGVVPSDGVTTEHTRQMYRIFTPAVLEQLAAELRARAGGAE
jgi:hypothetical protein